MTILSPSYLVVPGASLNFESSVNIGEVIVYKRHDFNFSSQTWNPYSYLMYEVISFKDSSVDESTATFIEAKRWISEDASHWLQTPFYNSFIYSLTPEDLFESGIIARLTAMPLHFSVTMNDEDLIIRSGLKIGDHIGEIGTTLNELTEGDSSFLIDSINEGYGIKLVERRWGCAIEGGTSKTIINITYTPRGLLSEFYFFETVNFGADSGGTVIEYEQFLAEDIDLNAAVFENLTAGWKKPYLTGDPATSGPESPLYSTVLVLSAFIILFRSRKRLK